MVGGVVGTHGTKMTSTYMAVVKGEGAHEARGGARCCVSTLCFYYLPSSVFFSPLFSSRFRGAVCADLHIGVRCCLTDSVSGLILRLFSSLPLQTQRVSDPRSAIFACKGRSNGLTFCRSWCLGGKLLGRENAETER